MHREAVRCQVACAGTKLAGKASQLDAVSRDESRHQGTNVAYPRHFLRRETTCYTPLCVKQFKIMIRSVDIHQGDGTGRSERLNSMSQSRVKCSSANCFARAASMWVHVLTPWIEITNGFRTDYITQTYFGKALRV